MKKLKKILYPICGIILLLAVWNLWKIHHATEKTESLYHTLAAKTETAREQNGEESSPKTTEAEETAEVKNPWLLELQKQNSDLAGWIRIPDTEIDYPVMQRTEDDDYYLKHDFEKNENMHGTPYLDVNCKIDQSENLIIYGHHMQDGTMFQNLMFYKDAAYCESNGTIEFDTPKESRKYQVVFVLLISVEEAKKFPYYRCIDLSNEEIYCGFLQQCSRYAIWQKETLPEPGTRLLTLSTCEYSKENGRMVVVAEQIEQ